MDNTNLPLSVKWLKSFAIKHDIDEPDPPSTLPLPPRPDEVPQFPEVPTH